MRHLLVVFFAVILLAVAAPASAQEVTATSRSAGMGEALTAGAAGSAAIWHNPAGVVSALMYSAEASYAYDAVSRSSGVTASLLDTKSNPSLGLGLAFTYETGSPEDGPGLEGYHFRGAIGVPLAGGFLRLGSTVRYSSISLDDQPVLEALLLDAGLIVQFTDAFSLGLVGHNLINGGYDEQAPQGLAAGLAFSSLELGLHVSGDVLMDMVTDRGRTWRAGAEYMIAPTVPLRAGYSYEERDDESSVTAGIGYRDRRSAVGLDLAYQQSLLDSAARSVMASLSLYL